MGDAKRRKEYLEHNPGVIHTPRKERHIKPDDDTDQVAAVPAESKPKDGVKFTAELLGSLHHRVAAKPRKDMSPEELKAWGAERNQRRRHLCAAKKVERKIGKDLANRKPTENPCRRKRLAKKHPEHIGLGTVRRRAKESNKCTGC